MESTFYNCTSLTTVPVIPSSITHMYNTFTYCTALVTAPEIPSSVTDLGSTFSHCTALTTVPEMPSSITSMSYVFSGCTSLTTAPVIPSSVTSISGIFNECTGLTTAPEIPSGVTEMSSAFQNCTGLTTAPKIPSGVTAMAGTFEGCTRLTTAPEIPNTVYNINCMFKNCTGLTTAPVIPNSVTDMYETFMGCTSLTTAPEIPNSVTSLYETFQDCSALTTVTLIPVSVTDLRNTFKNCTSLSNVQYNGTTEQWEAIKKMDCFNGSPITEIICNNGNACPSHTGGTANCQQKAVCTLCGNEYGEIGSHITSNGSCTICDLTITSIETGHYPHEVDLYNVVLGTWDYSGANSVNITITYETWSSSSTYCSITEGTDYVSGSSQYDMRNYINKYGELVNTTGDDYYVKIGDGYNGPTTVTFSNVSMLTGSVIFNAYYYEGFANYYGIKVEVTPNY